MRGVSPLVATVLLLAFVVSLAMIVGGWFSSYVRGVTGEVEETSEEAIGCSGASVAIERIYIDTSKNTSQILVKNMGTIKLTVKGAIASTAGIVCTNNTGINLTKGGMGVLKLSDCKGLNETTFDYATITTNCPGIGDEVTKDEMSEKVTFYPHEGS